MSAIKGGIAYIAKRQLASGGFDAFRLDGSSKLRYETTFIPSLILLALKDVPRTKTLRRTISTFLLKQASEAWTWNYWDRFSGNPHQPAYPDDLDATFVAMSGLYTFDRNIFTATRMAHMANVLFATETKPGGPYRTWLVDETVDKVWKDVDLVVNINVAGFLALHNVTLDAIGELIEKAIKESDFRSPYYPSFQPAVYFLSRWYHGPKARRLCTLILDKSKDGFWGDAHHTAMALCALLRLGYPPQELQSAVDYLLATQMSDGSWSAGPICVDVKQADDTQTYYIGSASLTTAVCVEALVLYEELCKKEKTIKLDEAKEQTRYVSITSQTTQLVERLQYRELRKQTHLALHRILTQDKDRQIIMLPWLVARAAETKTPETLLSKLAVASLWGWTAYTIFDDFMDNEGDPAFLPSAVFAHRQLLATFQEVLPGDKAFHKEIRHILTRLDQANAWEVTHCRGVIRANRLFIKKLPDYGDYWQLADRSLGHTIAGMGVFYEAGRDAESKRALHDFFRHYLIARQLNDDAHDWEEDLRLGHVNAVAVQVLRRWVEHHSLSNGIHLKKDLEELQMILWKSVIDEVCKEIHTHIAKAKEALGRAEMNEAILLPMLNPLERAADKVLATRDEALEFIAAL